MDWRFFFTIHWLECALIAAALVLAGWPLLIRRRRAAWPGPVLIASAAALVLAGGGLLVRAEWGWWLAAAALAGLFGMALVVVLSGRWWAPLAIGLAAIGLAGLGGYGSEPANLGLAEAGRALVNLEALAPWWLVLLALVPVVVLLSYRSLAGLGPVRRWLAIGLRSALVAALALALAEVRIRHVNERLTVFFLVDRSLSVPEEWETVPDSGGKRVDRRWERIKRFVSDSISERGPGAKWDKSGMIVFGRRPRLELPASDVPRLKFTEVTSVVDSHYTDIGAAIKLALASFPEGTAKRIVLISDGNENLGNALAQARLAKNNDVQLDVVPLAAGYRNENDVLVQGVEAPALTEQSAQLPIRVLLRSYNPRTVLGLLTLRQISEGQSALVPPSPIQVQVRPGLNSIAFKQTLAREQKSYTYEAVFQPLKVVDDEGKVVRSEALDSRPENKRATTHVIARGQRRVLLVEAKAGEHQLLVDRLRAIGGDSKFKVHAIESGALPERREDLGVFLSDYDCVILANVPADLLSDDQQEMIRSNTHDQGCGLIMIGGPEGFGAGGWQGTPVEKALPVDCDIKSLKVQGKGGLVLFMHASEMADGNRWQKEIAKLAIRKLSPMDEVGILYYDWGTTRWHVPLQEIGSKRAYLLRKVDTMMPGDMPDFDPGLQMAFKSLTEPERNLTTKHVIIISDGDPQQNDRRILQKMKANKVTVTTVGVATHGPPQDQSMGTIAKATGGRFYSVRSARALPSIYIKETRIVSQSFVYEKRFQPRLLFKGGPTEKLPDVLSPLYGYVRTTPKTSPLVQMPILAPSVQDQDFPILAYWHYGLGKSVAFTSDARSLPDRPAWDRDWARSDIYLKFWEQTVDWAIRAVETGKLTMSAEYQDGKVTVTVEARDKADRPLTDLAIRGGVTAPSAAGEETVKAPGKQGALKFEQRNAGIYVAEFKADEAGSYFVNAQAQQVGADAKGAATDSVRVGVTIPYSPEFADMESNAPLMEKLRALTGGETYADSDAALEEAARSGVVYRHSGLPPSRDLQPIWYWLLLAAGVLLFFDVAVRRIALDFREVAANGGRVWARLRRREVREASAPQFLERLRSKKVEVAESMAKGARRFEAGPAEAGAAPAGAHETQAEAPPPRPAPPVEERKVEEAETDFAARLLKAKRKVWEDRDKEGGPTA